MSAKHDEQKDFGLPLVDGPSLRRRAEKKARAIEARDLASLSPEESARLLHELQVHQIELEMQNEELRRSQEELERSRARYFELYDLAPVGYFTLSERSIILEANLTSAAMLGLPKGALSRTPLTRYILPDDQDIYYRHRKRLFDKGEPQVFEIRVMRPDGAPFWARVEAHVAQNGGSGAPACRAVMIDITGRKQAEEALKESEARYRSYIELTGQLGWATSADGVAVEDSPTWRRFTGQSEEEIKGEGWSKAIHPEDFEHTDRVWRSAVAEKKDYEVEYRLRRYDGVYRHFLARGAPVLKGDGGVYEWVGTCIDITERMELEQEIRRANDELEFRVQERTKELERRNQDLVNFTFVAAHDLQEPLRKIHTFADLLSIKYAAGIHEHGRDYLQRMQDTASRMRDHLQALLEYSRLTAEAEPFTRVSLNEIAHEVVSHLEVQIKESGAIVEIGELPEIDGDSRQLSHLLHNLVANGVKFRREGEIPWVKIHVNCPEGSRSGACEICVEDNGIGLDEQYQDRIFMPFQRLHGRTEYGGVGMGLAICNRVMERHNGTIRVKSTPGRGSTFILTLPMRQNQSTNEPH